MFHEILDSTVILRSRGVFRQSKCFAYNGQVFAKFGGGFIKLMKYQKGTSCPHVSWDEIALPFPVRFSPIGAMLSDGGNHA